MSLVALAFSAILLSPGVHELESTMEISPSDSGCRFGPDDPSTPAVLSGGRTIKGWQVGEDRRCRASSLSIIIDGCRYNNERETNDECSCYGVTLCFACRRRLDI